MAVNHKAVWGDSRIKSTRLWVFQEIKVRSHLQLLCKLAWAKSSHFCLVWKWLLCKFCFIQLYTIDNRQWTFLLLHTWHFSNVTTNELFLLCSMFYDKIIFIIHYGYIHIDFYIFRGTFTVALQISMLKIQSFQKESTQLGFCISSLRFLNGFKLATRLKLCFIYRSTTDNGPFIAHKILPKFG